MHDYRALLEKIATWDKPGVKLFIHVFSHDCNAYPFRVRDSSDWMARHFFTEGEELRWLVSWRIFFLAYAERW